MKVLDLFSGIGGFSLGLERAGMETAAFCESDKFCHKVLHKHWPEVPIYKDVRNVTADQLRRDGIRGIDVICGGFPCQDISVAGEGAGLEGERSGLWSEFARIIGDIRPRYVIVENVSALLSRGLGTVLGDLAEIGYDAEWHCIPAAYIGAPHRRDRIWLVANSMQGEERPWGFGGMQAREGTNWPGLVLPEGGGMADGIPNWVDRVGGCGNAVVPQIPEMIGRAIMENDAS